MGQQDMRETRNILYIEADGTRIRFSLIKHPRLMELCKEQKICVEVCPIS